MAKRPDTDPDMANVAAVAADFLSNERREVFMAFPPG